MQTDVGLSWGHFILLRIPVIISLRSKGGRKWGKGESSNRDIGSCIRKRNTASEICNVNLIFLTLGN